MPFQRETKSFGEIYAHGRKFKYTLERKNVKNINLRIKPSGEVYVSANRRVSQKTIEGFITSKADFVFKAIDKYSNRTLSKQYFAEDEIYDVVNSLCQKAYPYFEKRGVNYPQIKFKKLKSRWGSCYPNKEVLTFNINLMYAPAECIWYVVLHEFTHFLVPNHSKKFYDELCKICPDWKRFRRKLKEIII